MIFSLLLSACALIALFFKLPGVPEFFGITQCTSCSTSTPYLPMFGAGYFAALFTLILCFRSLPVRSLKWGGYVWSIGLALILTTLSPSLCYICLIAHFCHIGVWHFWKPSAEYSEELKEIKTAIVFTSTVSVMALYSTLNFMFLVYGLEVKNPLATSIKEGGHIQPFAFETLSSDELKEHSGVVLNFVSSNCPYCKEQIPHLNGLAEEFQSSTIRFVTICSQLEADLQTLGPQLEWIEDVEGQLSSLFRISGYPTCILLDGSGKVLKVIAGISTDFDQGIRKELSYLKLSQQ